MIGDSGVGKSNIISRYTMNIFKEDSLTTVGVEFGHKTVEIDNQIIKAQIWDTGSSIAIKIFVDYMLTNSFCITAGQDRFKALVRG